MLPQWVNEYIGLPYKPRGRDGDGLDCWGLCRKVLMDHYNKNLPAFEDVAYSPERKREVTQAIHERLPLVASHEVFFPEDGDLVLLSSRGFALHIAVYVGDGYILHTEPGKNAVLSRLADTLIASRLRGCYRVA